MEKNKRLAFIAGHRGMHLPLQEVKIQIIAVPAQPKKKKKKKNCQDLTSPEKCGPVDVLLSW
jgi:hypothetical protein